MSFRLFYTNNEDDPVITLPSSKSISNRLLIMQALSSQSLKIKNISQADDSQLLQELLASKSNELDTKNAGTVFRFLTAYFALQKGREVVLKGSSRMLERPIKPLVKALVRLGADIEYMGEEGYPPLRIKGTKLKKKKVRIDASQSSQFVSALLLVAPYIKDGLKIEILNPTSRPYIQMTLDLMKMAGIDWEIRDDLIRVWEGNYHLNKSYTVEADWSSAAFIYQAFTLSTSSTLKINDLKEDSLQGDSICAEIFENLGISSDFNKKGLRLKRHSYDAVPLSIDLRDQPDLILPFVISAAYLLPSVKVKGISSLRLKESNRLEALKAELEKIADIQWEESENLLKLSINSLNNSIDCFQLSSHDDHRIAMCFAPLAMIYQCLEIDDPKVVVKSFPNFWEEVDKIGIKLGTAI